MPDNLLQQVTDAFTQRVGQYAQGMAQYIGGPLSGHELSQDEAVQRWNYTPTGTPEQADQQYYNLLQQGMQPGQALQQVYPMRQQLIQGPDLSSMISKAKQIAGWVADAAGTNLPPDYQGNTQLLLKVQQTPPPPPMPAQPLPMGLGLSAPAGMPAPAPAGSPGPAPVPPPGAPGPMPPPPMPMPQNGPPPGPMPPPMSAPMPMPGPVGPPPLPPPAATAPPNAEAPLGGGMLPTGQGPTGTPQA